MRFLVAVGVAALACMVSSSARAITPGDVELAARTGLLTGESAVAWGLGACAGGTISGFYFGFSLIHYWGGESSVQPPSDRGVTTASGSTTEMVRTDYLLYGAELGYGITLFHRFTLRPLLGVGGARVSSTCTTGSAGGEGLICSGTATNGGYLEPGIAALVPLGSVLFAGVDADLLAIFGQGGGTTALTIHAQLGVGF